MEFLSAAGTFLSIVDSGLSIAVNVMGLYDMFKHNKTNDLPEPIRMETRRVLLTSTEVHDVDDQLILPGATYKKACDPSVWETAKKRVEEYKEELSHIADGKALVVASHELNLGALFLFGWYFDRNCHRSIVYSVLQESKIVFYPMDRLRDKGGKFFEKQLETRNMQSYAGIAVFVYCSNGNLKNDASFDRSVRKIESDLLRAPIYCMKFTRQGIVETSDAYVGGCKEIANDIMQARMEHCEGKSVPIFVYMQTAAPIALCLGMQLCQLGNVNVYTYENNDMTYRKAYALDVT